ncbi:MFS transporter [Microlunatus sp. GCM10028923]|uniref:MFS transporter n=1 Tax=Microlunatus sp. GCM10028923 TaxID=3273400 RepID=UPI00361889B9
MPLLSSYPALQDRRFRRLILATAVSLTGSAVSAAVLPLYILAITGSAALTGVIATIRLIGLVPAQLVAGGLVDKFSGLRVRVIGDAVKSICVLAAAATVMSAGSLALITVLLAIESIVGAILAPATVSMFRAWLPEASLKSAFSIWSFLFASTAVIGPPVAAVVYHYAGAGIAYLLDAATYLLSVAVLAQLAISLKSRANPPVEATERTPLLRSIASGMRHVVSQTFLRNYIFSVAVVNFTSAMMLFGLTVVLAQQSESVYGAGMAAIAFAGVAGSLLGVKVPDKRHYLQAALVSFVYGACMIGGAVLPAWPVLLTLFAISSVVSGALNVSLNSHVMQLVQPDLVGRVQSSLLVIGGSLYPFAASLTGVLIEYFSVSVMLIVASALTAIPLLWLGGHAYVEWRSKDVTAPR